MMGRSVQEIFQEAAELPDRDRAELAGMLIESLDGEPDPDAEAAWAEEIKERVRQVRTGELQSTPWEQVFGADERAVTADVTDSDIVVRLTDGRAVSVPLAWFPRLFAAPVEERKRFELIGDGIGLHWPTLDEDLSVAGFMRGVRSRP